ncbi:MAG TPA: response regulator [Terriglobales bacterium]|nr:response regulator [Terriglobales bacterium]
MTAADPELGLELIKQNRPQFVLLDLSLPNVSGMRLLEQIVDFDPGIEVFLFTGNYNPADCAQQIRRCLGNFLY